MPCCCGQVRDAGDKDDEGITQERSCRDVLFLLLFIAFWAGMFVVCGIAFKNGDAQRLVYGMDSSGFLCGTKHTYKNETIDLRASPYLYYLNPIDLLTPSNIKYAKSVCLPSCPRVESMCNISSLPCMNTTQYRCPYYRLSENSMYGRMPALRKNATQYWGDLGAASVDSCTIDTTSLKGSNSSFLALFGLAGLPTCSASTPTNVTGKYLQLTSMYPGEGPCYPVFAETVPYFKRCFPKFPPELQGSIIQAAASSSEVASKAFSSLRNSFNSPGQRLTNYIGDISKGILIIVVGGLAAGVVLCMIWMIILRYFAGVMAWATVAAVNCLMVGMTLWSYDKAGLLAGAGALGATISAKLPATQDPTEKDRQVWAYCAYAGTAATVLLLLITLVMIRRIMVAVATIKVASQAIAAMPSILFFPILPFIFEVGLVIYWIAVTAMLYSAGNIVPHWRAATSHEPYTIKQLYSASSNGTTPTPSPSPSPAATMAPASYANMTAEQQFDACITSPNCYLSVDWDTRLKYSFIYHLFGLLWTNQFIVGFSCVVVAAAVANFYWRRGDSSRMPAAPVLWSFRTTLRYHMGSIAFGAFLIAIIQFVRLVLEYVDRKTKEMQKRNQAAKWLLNCARCCMWCLEKIVKFINRNAYIMVAVKGTGYCDSAQRAVVLIIANALRLAAVNTVGDLLIWLGKVAVAAGCGLVAFAMSGLKYYNDPVKYPDTFLASPVFPVAGAVLVGFIVAEIFFAVYEMAVDTIMLCFCEDCETNSGHPRHAPPLLLEAIGERPAQSGQFQKK